MGFPFADSSEARVTSSRRGRESAHRSRSRRRFPRFMRHDMKSMGGPSPYRARSPFGDSPRALSIEAIREYQKRIGVENLESADLSDDVLIDWRRNPEWFASFSYSDVLLAKKAALPTLKGLRFPFSPIKSSSSARRSERRGSDTSPKRLQKIVSRGVRTCVCYQYALMNRPIRRLRFYWISSESASCFHCSRIARDSSESGARRSHRNSAGCDMVATTMLLASWALGRRCIASPRILGASS